MASHLKTLTLGSFCAALVIGMTGCGGGKGVTSDATETLKASYTAGLAGMSTPAVLTGNDLQDLFDSKFLDFGFTRADIVAALNGEAAAIQGAGGYSGVPQLTLSSASVTDCMSVAEAYICTLSGSLTNSDTDTTTVPFTTQVRMVDGKLRLYGDQSAFTN